jgi:uncharacterized protein YjgD (DUF1641 family)
VTVTETPLEVPAGQIEILESKIDRLTDQLAVLTADAEHRRRQREAFEDLTADLNRVSGDAMGMASRELDSLSATVDIADTVRLLRRLVEVAPTLERLLVGLTAASEFVEDAAPMGTDVMTMLTDRLAAAEQKGYFAFAAAATGVAERVVANFDERDVELLGDNIVVMLETLREVTQPEMLSFVNRALTAVKAEQAAVELESAEPPSLWSIAREIRDPEIRRGMARALNTLRAVSVETGPGPTIDQTTTSPTTQGETP